MRKPTKLHLRGSRTILDDFQSAHASMTEIVHYAVREDSYATGTLF